MEPYYSKKYNLQPGDRIVEPLFQTGVLKHHAIFLGTNNSGIEYVAENDKFKGVQIITAAAYFANIKSIDRIEKFNGSDTERRLLVRKALNLAGKPYNLISYNCEHFANEVISSKVISNQVDNILGGLLFGIIVAVTYSKD